MHFSKRYFTRKVLTELKKFAKRLLTLDNFAHSSNSFHWKYRYNAFSKYIEIFHLHQSWVKSFMYLSLNKVCDKKFVEYVQKNSSVLSKVLFLRMSKVLLLNMSPKVNTLLPVINRTKSSGTEQVKFVEDSL